MKIFNYIGAWLEQVGGDHYKKEGHIQPNHFSMANEHNTLQARAIVYLDRYRDKNGIEDLKKAKNVLNQLIEWEEGSIIKLDK